MFDILRKLLQSNNHFVANKKDTSFYRIYKNHAKTLQVRISNHGTYLSTWINRRYDPTLSDNVCIVISPNGTTDSKLEVETQKKRPYTVKQIVYNGSLLSEEDIVLIYKAILRIPQKGYVDPLEKTDKKGIPTLLISRFIPITHNKAKKMEDERINNITENKRYNNMKKQTIRLNESQLHKLIKESIKNVLNEIGDTPKGQYKLGRIAGMRARGCDSMYGDEIEDWDKHNKDVQDIEDYARAAYEGGCSSDFLRGFNDGYGRYVRIIPH